MSIKSGLRGIAALAIAGIAGFAAPVTAQQGGKIKVDLELLLAVDISQSMDFDEHTIQREGYVEAFRHKSVINALTSGPHGKIAVMYMEWAGDFDPIPTIPWTIIDSEKAAHDFADRLANEPVFGEQRTSISTALLAAKDYILNNEAWKTTNAFKTKQVFVSIDNTLLQAGTDLGPVVSSIRTDFLKNR